MDADDYIAMPRESGYRGIHLIWRYESDKRAEYNDLKIEMQLRTSMQHAWATAVETVGTFLEEALKSSIGSPEWLRFFALMGTAIADREGTAPVPGTPLMKDDWSRELYHLARGLNVEHRLYGFSAALRIPELHAMKDAAYFLLHLNRATQMVTVKDYTFGQLEEATNDYLEAEKDILKNKNSDAVLVSVSSVAALRRAYPNYFADTNAFAQLVRDAVSQHHTEPSLI